MPINALEVVLISVWVDAVAVLVDAQDAQDVAVDVLALVLEVVKVDVQVVPVLALELALIVAMDAQAVLDVHLDAMVVQVVQVIVIPGVVIHALVTVQPHAQQHVVVNRLLQ